MSDIRRFSVIADNLCIHVILRGASDAFYTVVRSFEPPKGTNAVTNHMYLDITVDSALMSEQNVVRQTGNVLNLRLERPAKGTININSWKGTFRIAPTARGLNPIFSMMYFFHILEQGGFMLHASSVVIGKKAYVYIGRQGVGKSTIARLSHAPQLSDDITVVIPEKDGYSVIANPFDPNIQVSVTGRYPLDKCLWLRHTDQQRDVLTPVLRPIPLSRLQRHLRPNLKFIEYSPRYLFLLSLGIKLFTSRFHRHYNLEFSKSQKFLALITKS